MLLRTGLSELLGNAAGRSVCSLPWSTAPRRTPERVPSSGQPVTLGRVTAVSTGQYDVDAVRPRGGRLPRRERRAQLLASALEVFVAQGYHAAAMDDIADRAGVSKPVLYQHFPGKLELYLALLDESAEKLTAIVRDALSSTTENRERVPATFRAFFDFVGDEGEAFRLVFESDLSNEPAVRARLERSTHECASMISLFIREDAGVGEAEAYLLGIALAGMAQ